MSKEDQSTSSTGTLSETANHTVTPSGERIKIKRFRYNKDHAEEASISTFDQSIEPSTQLISWIDVCGLHSADHIRDVGLKNNIHPLILEDIASTTQRPKIDEYEDYLFIVLKLLISDTDEFQLQQASFILTKNHVLSFQESLGDNFKTVKNRIRSNKGKIRSEGTDYLLYSLIDVIVDRYTDIVEILGSRIEEIENDIYEGSIDPLVSKEILQLKRKTLKLRKAILPLTEILHHIITTRHPNIKKATINYFEDIDDHVNHILDEINFYREMLKGLNDLYISGQNTKMNEIMKTLTVISTVFIPLSFIAAVYGMNFKNMPELTYDHAYFVVIGLMVLIVIGMFVYFKKKKWF